MLTIFSDAAFDNATKIGTYCLVALTSKGKTKWSVTSAVGFDNANDAEYAGITAAIELAAKYKEKALIYCDSKSAISRAEKEIAKNLYTLRHIRGHQMGKEKVIVSMEVKYHHWADVQAHAELKRILLDISKTRAYNEEVKET